MTDWETKTVLIVNGRMFEIFRNFCNKINCGDEGGCWVYGIGLKSVKKNMLPSILTASLQLVVHDFNFEKKPDFERKLNLSIFQHHLRQNQIVWILFCISES